MQEEENSEQAEADKLVQKAEQLKKEAEEGKSAYKYLEAADLFDEAAKHCPKAGEKNQLKDWAEHARVEAHGIQSERLAPRGKTR